MPTTTLKVDYFLLDFFEHKNWSNKIMNVAPSGIKPTETCKHQSRQMPPLQIINTVPVPYFSMEESSGNENRSIEKYSTFRCSH
jgi:hypothetical protein